MDLIDIPPHLLAKAINKHVMQSPYLPKASDLVKLAKEFIPRREPLGAVGETLAERGNRLMGAEHAKRMRWVQDHGGLRLEDIA